MAMPFPRSHINLPPADVLAAAAALFIRPSPGWVDEFARRLGRFLGAGQVIPVGSGRDALKLLLEDLGPEGGEIIFPAYTYHPMPVLAAAYGYIPVFADVDPATWNIDPAKTAKLISPRTRAIVPTHFLGVPADLAELRDLADRHGVLLIEDCAHAFGSTYRGVPVGRHGDAGIFTFAMSKNMPCFGGGALIVADPGRFQRLSSRLGATGSAPALDIWKRQFGNVAAMAAGSPLLFPWTLYPLLRLADFFGLEAFDRKFIEEVRPPVPAERGAGKSLAPLQALIGCRQLERFPGFLSRHVTRALRLRAALRGARGLVLQELPEDRTSAFLSVRVRVADPAGFRRRLRRLGVDTRPDEMRNCAALDVLPARFECPVAVSLAGHCIEIPCWHTHSDRDIDRLAAAVAKAL
jgi:dTDP-4-amino-4,6-dideoxygalactose transaminase